MSTSDRIKEARKAAGLTQKELASKLGVKHSAVSKYEQGRVVNLKRETIANIAAVLNVKPSWLMCMDDSPKKTTIELSEKELAIIDMFRAMNEEGQEKVYDYIRDLTEFGKYQKGLSALTGTENA